MRIRVRLFGAEADAAGRSSVEINLDESATTADVLRRIGEAVPDLRPRLPHARLAVNHAFARPEEPIREGDEVALIGPVSGG